MDNFLDALLLEFMFRQWVRTVGGSCRKHIYRVLFRENLRLSMEEIAKNR